MDPPSLMTPETPLPLPETPQSDPIKALQAYIDEGHCPTMQAQMSDAALAQSYRSSPSMQKKRLELKAILARHLPCAERESSALLEELLDVSVPPGLKGVLRGNVFNRLVGDEVRAAVLDAPHLTVTTEEKLDYLPEIPDWCVHDAAANKHLIGYNQLDLWIGGQQTNRGSKYILNDEFHDRMLPNVRIVSVVAQHVKLQSTKNKTYELFARGVPTARLLYPRHMRALIQTHFGKTGHSLRGALSALK